MAEERVGGSLNSVCHPIRTRRLRLGFCLG